jgi:hypothetical protein
MTAEPRASILYGINATRGVIGICPKLRVYSGYEQVEIPADNSPPDWMGDGNLADWQDEQYSPEERRALAEEMIRRWTAYRDAID